MVLSVTNPKAALSQGVWRGRQARDKNGSCGWGSVEDPKKKTPGAAMAPRGLRLYSTFQRGYQPSLTPKLFRVS